VLAGLGMVVAVAAAASSFLALRDARVGPMTHENELATLRPLVGHHSTLFLGKDDFAQWELHGVNLALGRFLYAPYYEHPRPSKPLGESEQLDFDNFLPAALDKYRYVITGNTPYQSSAPPDFKVVARTPSYLLWKRSGRTPLRYPVDFAGAPGGTLNCKSGFGRLRLGGAGAHGTAAVSPRPVVATQNDWRGQPREAGDSASLSMRVPRGRWDLSMQYVSTTGLTVDAPGLEASLPPNLDRIGPFFSVGTFTVPEPRTVVIHVKARQMNSFAHLLGAPGATRALNSPGYLPLNRLALTRHRSRPRIVPVREACGRYVDWVAPPAKGGSAAR
jgi:hypothetical protein